MPQQTIILGAFPEDKTGDTLRVGGDKINDNFNELYALQSKTLNAAAFPGGTYEEQIQNAINQALLTGEARVRIPTFMIPFDASLIVFSPLVHMVREGGNDSVYEPEAYGAAGDTVRFDHLNVQACVNQAAGIGTIILNRLYLCAAQIRLPSNTELTGNGWETGLVFTSALGNTTHIINSDPVGGNSSIHLRSFMLQGYWTGGPAPAGQQPAGINLRYVDDFEVQGLRIYHVKGISLAYQASTRGRIIGNRIDDGGRDGIAGYWELEDIVVANNTIHLVGDDGIALNNDDTSHVATAPIKRVAVIGNTILSYNSPPASDGKGRGINVAGAQGLVISGNVIAQTFAAGIIVGDSETFHTYASKNIVIGNNVIIDAGQEGDGSQPQEGIRVVSVASGVESDGVTIIGNRIVRAKRKGIHVARAFNVLIEGNNISDHGVVVSDFGIDCDGESTQGRVADILVQNNIVRDGQGGGIRIFYCDRATASGNQCMNNGKSGNGSDSNSSGFNVTGSGTYVVKINGNRCGDTQGTKTQRHGIRVENVGTPTGEITNNDFTGNFAGSISVLPAAHTIYQAGNRISTGAIKGRAVLVAGTVVVATTEVLAAENISLTRVVGGGTARGMLEVGAIVAATSFVINAKTAANAVEVNDTSTIMWEIIH
jgi:hypothetical protein